MHCQKLFKINLMKNISPNNRLQALILQLEQEQQEKGLILRAHLHNTYNSLKPINLLKEAVSEIVSVDYLKDNIVNNIVSLTSGYISKKIIIGKSDSVLRKIIGTIVQLGVTKVVSINSTAIKTMGMFLFQKFQQRKDNEIK